MVVNQLIVIVKLPYYVSSLLLLLVLENLVEEEMLNEEIVQELWITQLRASFLGVGLGVSHVPWSPITGDCGP